MQDANAVVEQNLILDARGLLCPFPVLKVQNHLNNLIPGKVLELFCTDKGSLYDIPVFCKLHGLIILETLQTEEDIRFKIALPE